MKAIEMPKLDKTHLERRIRDQIEKLESGKDIILRDVKAVLSKASLTKIDVEWEKQKQLRKAHRPRNSAEKTKLGWKEKRDLYLDALNAELSDAKEGMAEAWRHKVEQANVRQAKIYFEALNEAEQRQMTPQSAKSFANNELTRAGLRRMDGQEVGHANKRSREMAELEDTLRRRGLTAAEIEYEEALKKQNEQELKAGKNKTK